MITSEKLGVASISVFMPILYFEFLSDTLLQA